MGLPIENIEVKEYIPIPTLKLFHESRAQIRCCVGPVGSGKTSAATMEIGYYLPWFLYGTYHIKKTRWLVLRNTYPELRDTTIRTFFDWFEDAEYRKQENIAVVRYDNGIEAEILFRSCDRPEDVKKFKSLELTGYWIDESIEVADDVKRMLKNRIGRFPQRCPVRFGIETTNPPDVEHTTYSEFKWQIPPPGPLPKGQPKPNHEGFWQPPYENEINLRPNYYADLRNDYQDTPDWIEMYIEGKPGMIVKGKLVYSNFKRDRHVAAEPLIWSKGPLYRGWDNTGNTPACVVAQVPTPMQIQILKEFTTDRMGMVDFTSWVVSECNRLWPNATWRDWADPAGENRFSKRSGGFTSNAQLMRDEGVNAEPSEQNLTARITAVDQALARYDGLLIDPSCTRLINGFLGGYHYKPQPGVPGEYSDIIEKNRFSHVHDAVQYLIVRLLKTKRPGGHFRPDRSKRRF